MLDIVKMMSVVDIHDLIDAMGEIEGLSRHDIFSEFQDMHCYGGGNESYIEIREDFFLESLYDFTEEDIEFDDMSGEEILKTLHPESNREKVRYRLFEMMVKEDLPKEFIVHLWW
jgi:hypothetical protein